MRFAFIVIIFAAAFWNIGCDRGASSQLKGQSNTKMTFFGKAVDQDGAPLEGVTFKLTVETIPADWTFETRGKPHDRKEFTVKTGADGRFQADMSVHVFWVEDGQLPGYRHFYAKWSDDSNTGYQVTAWGDVLYRSDYDHPAVYVFVKDGAREVAVLPGRGGFRSYGKNWIANQPIWPRNPSLNDVVRKAVPQSQPSGKAG